MEKKEDLGGIEGTYKEEEGPIEKWKDRGRREQGIVGRRRREGHREGGASRGMEGKRCTGRGI